MHFFINYYFKLVLVSFLYLFFYQIITRARKRYLFDEYIKKHNDSSSLNSLVSDVRVAYNLTEKKAQNEQDKDKKEMYVKMLAKVNETLSKLDGNKTPELRNELLSNSSEILSTWLDKAHGKNVTDNSIFSALPRHYEGEFHKDMAALNVRII
jgi:cysteinyl-tRNA synthetase